MKYLKVKSQKKNTILKSKLPIAILFRIDKTVVKLYINDASLVLRKNFYLS